MRRVAVTLAVVSSLVVGTVWGGAPVVAQEPRGEEAGGSEERPEPQLERPELPDVPEPETPESVPNAGPLSPPTEATSPDSPPTAADRASAAAHEGGERVEVVEWRTETSITFANPDGSFTEERAAGPVRVETDEGEWVDADPTLVVDEEGVRPRAVPNEVVLSDGGPGEPLVSVTDPGVSGDEVSEGERRTGEAAEVVAEDRSVSVGVAEELPVPRLDGNRAVYPEVLDGADLVVSASTVGAEVSVVIPEPGAGRPVYECPVSSFLAQVRVWV